MELIQELEDKNLSRALSGMVNRYNYQQLLALLDPK